MDIVQAGLTPMLLVFMGLAGGSLFKDGLDRIEARIDGLGARIDALPTQEELNGLSERLGRLEADVGALRSDLARVPPAVGARPRPHTG